MGGYQTCLLLLLAGSVTVANGKLQSIVSFSERVASASRRLDQFEYDDAERPSYSCDQALFECHRSDACGLCFRSMNSAQVDWGTVTHDTDCIDVAAALEKKEYCSGISKDSDAMLAFCDAYHLCTRWDDENDDEGFDASISDDVEFIDGLSVDCNNITACDWQGFHSSFLGDGICHDSIGGCYNTAICGYDGGDCCADTCEDKDNVYINCGHDGYVCRDPSSKKCDPMYSSGCENIEKEETKEDMAVCTEDQSMYRLVMYDSFGDGWDATKMTIAPKERKTDIRFAGRLESGSIGTSYVCLSRASTCYHVDVSGGAWGNEVSWEVKPLNEGAPAVAGGGSPMSCDFAVAGDECENTCSGKPNVDVVVDSEYKEFKDMYNCIQEFCFIQTGICEQDVTCSICMAEEAADFCYANDKFIALIDCTMCHCTDRKDSDFCTKKMNPAKKERPGNSFGGRDGHDQHGGTGSEDHGRFHHEPCSPSDTMKGSDAVLTFGQCSNLEDVSMVVTNFDNDHFGDLDSFELCSHSFNLKPNHGGHTALGCMQILVNSINAADLPSSDPSVPTEAIAALSRNLYDHPEEFCECSKKASDGTPQCRNFHHFKTLLYESLDACQALDEIDCDAWSEFFIPCKTTMENFFGGIDFNKSEQCSYIQDGCGGSGPFPAFRRLDCGTEVSVEAWEFYRSYSRGCHEVIDTTEESKTVLKPNEIPVVTPNSQSKPIPVPARVPPTPAPVAASKKMNTVPTPYPTRPVMPYIPWDGSTSFEEYQPYESPTTGKKSHFFRNFFFICVISAVGFLYYKNQSDSFNFVRYRNSRNYGGATSDMNGGSYSGLANMESSTSFEPPSLPPTPSSIDGDMT